MRESASSQGSETARNRAPKRVVLHVGVPKSGTTFLQRGLAENRAALEADGVLYPGDKRELMFRATLDLRGNHQAWGRKRADVMGAWDEVCRKARRFEGTTVISHELLAAASSHQIAAAMPMLADLEVHVVVTARDPASQVTAEWQEGIKHGRTQTFEQFRQRLLEVDGPGDLARRFAAAQYLPGVLARWGAAVPPHRTHVVCVPPAGSDPAALWRLFAEAVGFDPEAHPVTEPVSNASLGVAEIDLLRRVNSALGGRLVQPHYGKVVKHWFAHRLLADQVGSPRPRLPLEMYDGLAHDARQWVKEIDRAGYVVHGDLQHLVPVPPQAPAPHPDVVDPQGQVATAATLLAEVLLEVDRLRTAVADLEDDKKRLKKKRKKLRQRLAGAIGS